MGGYRGRVAEGMAPVMTAEERQTYIAAVVYAIHGTTPEQARISSADFDIIATWMDKEIPLRWVLQALEQMGKVSSVRHARPAVLQEIERCQRALGHGVPL